MITKGQTREQVKWCPLCQAPLLKRDSQLTCEATKHPNTSIIISFYTNGTVDGVYLTLSKRPESLYDYYAIHVFYGEGDVFISHYIDFKKKGRIILKDMAGKFPIKEYTHDQLSTYILFS